MSVERYCAKVHIGEFQENLLRRLSVWLCNKKTCWKWFDDDMWTERKISDCNCRLHEVTRHFLSRSDLVKKLLKPLAVSSKAVATQKTS